MKRRTFLALGLTAALSIPFAMTAFAEGEKYSAGQYVEFSGHTDFDYYYTYTVGSTKKVNYKCFSVVNDGVRTYAAVKEDLYEYYRAAFADKDVMFKGSYHETAGDGSNVILPIWEVNRVDGKNTVYKLENYVAPLLYKEGETPNFKLFGELYDAGVVVSVSSDGSSMTIDTNPLNIKNSFIFKYDAIDRIKLTNKALGLPEWLYEEMGNTRAVDGRQKEIFDHVTVTWTFAPSQGLEVMYRANA